MMTAPYCRFLLEETGDLDADKQRLRRIVVAAGECSGDVPFYLVIKQRNGDVVEFAPLLIDPESFSRVLGWQP